MFKIFLLLCFSTQTFATLYETSIMAIFRDEAPYMKEWIEFHRLIGIEHFYLTNHLSKDHFEEVLKPYIEAGIVELNHVYTQIHGQGIYKWRAWNTLQCSVYDKILNEKKHETKWLIGLDLDEYIVPYGNIAIHKLLENYEAFGGVALNWKNFGTSDVKEIPPDRLMIESLIKRAGTGFDWNGNFKTFVRPERVKNYGQPHWPTCYPPYYVVTTDKKPIEKLIQDKPCYTLAAIHHFWTKDESFFERVKLKRRQDWTNTNEILYRKNRCNEVVDTSIFPYIEPLRFMMFNNP